MAAATLWEGVVHATAFALLGILVYLVWRRWSPAAGSLAAASTLVLMTFVSVLSFLSLAPVGPGVRRQPACFHRHGVEHTFGGS